MLYIIRTDLTSWFQICMTLKSISSIWPLVVKKLVRVDRFWSIHLVCSEHTTYTHHSNRLGELIPNLYRMSSISTNLTPFGQKQWLNLTTYDHFNEFCHTYDTCTSIECIFRDEFKNFDFGVTWGHPGSSKGSNKVISGSKIGNIAKCTWYAYESIQNFILILKMSMSRSFEVILGSNKVILRSKISNIQMHWYTYGSITNFVLNSMVYISRSTEVI